MELHFLDCRGRLMDQQIGLACRSTSRRKQSASEYVPSDRDAMHSDQRMLSICAQLLLFGALKLQCTRSGASAHEPPRRLPRPHSLQRHVSTHVRARCRSKRRRRPRCWQNLKRALASTHALHQMQSPDPQQGRAHLVRTQDPQRLLAPLEVVLWGVLKSVLLCVTRFRGRGRPGHDCVRAGRASMPRPAVPAPTVPSAAGWGFTAAAPAATAPPFPPAAPIKQEHASRGWDAPADGVPVATPVRSLLLPNTHPRVKPAARCVW
jgi:hypothetical protein